ncbi:MAG: CPBP family intramembrane glutamic endopeptidase [Ekhidna sp.]
MYWEHIIKLLERHRLACLLAVFLGISVIGLGVAQDSLPKVLTYLSVIICCFLLSEFIFYSGKLILPDWNIRQQKIELIVIISCEIVMLLLLIYWFVFVDPGAISKGGRIGLMILRLLFGYPIFFLIYFLGIKRYSLANLGFRLKHWYVAAPIIILIGGSTYLTFPEGLKFQDVLQHQGVMAFLTLGLLTASIPEELTRHLFQSRLSALTSKSIGWFVVSLVWALTHIPSFGSQSGDYIGATISAIGILPIGLLWGYLNQRYRSIIPSVIIHGTNLWGLQNIF